MKQPLMKKVATIVEGSAIAACTCCGGGPLPY